jgi:hypothetical protein
MAVAITPTPPDDSSQQGQFFLLGAHRAQQVLVRVPVGALRSPELGRKKQDSVIVGVASPTPEAAGTGSSDQLLSWVPEVV